MVSGCSFSNKPPYLQENVKEIAGLEKLSEVAKVLGEFGCANFKFREEIAGWQEMQQVEGPEGKGKLRTEWRCNGLQTLRSEAHRKMNEDAAGLEDDALAGRRDSYHFCFGKVFCVLRCSLDQ
jgi:hypothetical protein